MDVQPAPHPDHGHAPPALPLEEQLDAARQEIERWSQNLCSVPSISFQQIDKWADENVNIPKRIQNKGYSNWIEGYIHDIERKFGFNFTSMYIDLLQYLCCACSAVILSVWCFLHVKHKHESI